MTNGVNCGSAVPLSGGSASSAAISSLAVGNHTVTASYSGDGGFNASSGTLAGGQTVNKANSSTAVASSVNPSLFGQPVTFTAMLRAVVPGAGTPTGTVQFKTNGVNFGSAVTLAGGSASSAAISSLAVGTNAVTADYSGDSSFNLSSGSLPSSQTGGTSVPARLAGSVVSGRFQVVVTAQSNVTYLVQGSTNLTSWVTLSTNTASAGGTFTFTDTTTPTPPHRFYRTMLTGGQVVIKAGSTTAVTSSANPSVFSQPVTFTATLAAVAPGAGTPSGTVQFKTNGVNFGSAVGLSSGSATSPAISSLAVGSYTVTADYSGDSGFNTSSGALTGSQIVNMANSLTAVASSANPSLSGQQVTFTATVTPAAPGTGTPTGTVQFKINGVNFGSPVALTGGSASSLATTNLAVGNYAITVDYSGDSGFNASNGGLTGGQTVNKANSSTAVASSANPSLIGQSVTFTATLTAVAPGAGTPTGTVQFKTNGVSFGSAVPLSGGSASSAAITFPVFGHYPISADYSGDGSFNTSTGTLPGGQTVNNPAPATLAGAIVSGQFQLTVTAQPNFTYVVLGSTNLVDWVPLSTNTAPAGGTFTFTDTASPTPQDRYYRTMLQAP